MTVGTNARRIDSSDKVTGAALYPGDLSADNVLSAKVVFSDRPHARMVSMDTAAAFAVDGVVEVVTAADIPLNEYGLTMFDQPVLIGVDGTGKSHIPSNISRWEADQVAIVIAETEASAIAGARALTIEWEDLPLAPDLTAAKTDETLVHPENPINSNTYTTLRIRKGDMEAGWAEADVVIEGTYHLPHQEHAYLQPEAGLAYVDADGVVTVKVAGQWTHEDREQIAHALELPEPMVRVIYPAIGGAFGGREDMSLQIVLAAAALKLHHRGIDRPVRIVWNREESIVGHHKRHRAEIATRWGARKDGSIVAVEAEAFLDAGAYNYTSSKVLANLHLTITGPYNIDNAHIDSHAVYTHSVPGGAFRGFGGPQGSFVSENQMNKVAEALDMDPIEIRRINLLHDGDDFITQRPMPDGVSIETVIDELVEVSEWDQRRPIDVVVPNIRTLGSNPSAIRTGRGMACALKNVGFTMGMPEQCEATVTLRGDDYVEFAELVHAGADVGQGAHTAFLQMLAEAVDIPFENVTGSFSDTATSGNSGSASASRLTFMAGNSIQGATEEAKKAWIDGDRPALGHFRYVPPPTEAMDPTTGKGNVFFALGYVAEIVEIAVDVETGHVRVGTVYCAVDVGKAINPTLVRGQVEGAIVQAHGYALTERLRVKDGRIENPTLSGYLVPGSMDTPDRIETISVEVADPLGPWGARGMAEMPFIPYAPAVVAALHDATGVWFDEIPLTPDRVLAGLKEAGVS
ncbi:MAG: xanthine dehydrogenase family protein molybdopterin-binding subunit [Acidimicrobiia bacterium]|nr:xanthine dehydrogenase family protein molybdopterin-binding subunit [Acidimicrobiia bacterium]